MFVLEVCHAKNATGVLLGVRQCQKKWPKKWPASAAGMSA